MCQWAWNKWSLFSWDFPVVLYSCESCTTKRAEHQRMDAFELWFWRRLLKVPSTARSNQSILREINSEYSLEGLMLKLKLHYFVHLMLTDESLEKCLMLGKIEGGRKRGHQRMRWLDWYHELELEQTLGNGDGQGSLECCSSWGNKESNTTGWLKNNSNSLVIQDKVQWFVLR